MHDAVTKYRELFPTYEIFASRIESLLVEMLRAINVKVHFTESRAKSVSSFAEKLSRPGKSFDQPLDDMPDLAGIRLVLYYLDDIPRVGELIKQEFDTVEEVTEHQADHYSPDQFGYLSMHYIVKLNAARNELTEWKTFVDCRAEIQVRTVLQHSWAAVSHALQYKREGDVPFRLRRQLFRLAGLFELADEEFIVIRDRKEKITTATQATSEDELKEAALDAPVIRKLISTSSQFSDAVALMRSIGYVFVAQDEDSEEIGDFVGKVVEECERLEIPTVRDLETALNFNWDRYLRAIYRTEWNVNDSFALYLLLIGAFPKAFTIEHLVKSGWHEGSAKQLVGDINSAED
ncbi:MAG: GTP pyrophosphokinase family protein [Synechococcus sp.]